MSATLGKQALNKGLLAGMIGLIAVVIFLLSYYRVLGLIAVGGLFVYGLYFFALIKLIPIVADARRDRWPDPDDRRRR